LAKTQSTFALVYNKKIISLIRRCPTRWLPRAPSPAPCQPDPRRPLAPTTAAHLLPSPSQPPLIPRVVVHLSSARGTLRSRVALGPLQQIWKRRNQGGHASSTAGSATRRPPLLLRCAISSRFRGGSRVGALRPTSFGLMLMHKPASRKRWEKIVVRRSS
jgi:hypothetical protein